MVDRFFDTSSFTKHDHTEVGSARVDAMLVEAGSRHDISSLGIIDLRSSDPDGSDHSL